MCWSKAWHDGMRRRVRWHRAGMVSMGIVAIAIGTVCVVLTIQLTEAARTAGLASATTGMLVVQGGFILIIVIGLAIQAGKLHREQVTMRIVPEHDGMVCPRCRRVLAVRGDRAACDRCKREYSAHQVREDWTQYPHVNPKLWRPRSMASGRLRTLLWSLRNRPMWGAAFMFAIWIALVAFNASIWKTGLFVQSLRTSPLLALMMGIQLIGMGVKRRVGDSLHCTKCDYERAPVAAPAGGSHAGDACPECGLKWDEPGALVRGRNTRSPKLIWTGSALLALFMVAFLGGERLRGVAPTWMLLAQVRGNQSSGRSSYDLWPILAARPLGPEERKRLTDLLIDEIIAGHRGFVNREWAVLAGRPMSPEQERRLFEGLLGKHETKGYLTPEDRAWMESMIEDGAVAPDLAERYPGDS